MKRTKLEHTGGNYFTNPKTDIQFIKSGSTMLDCALGGGWAEGRIINVVGDKSTGKTLLAIEGAANFVAKHQKGKVKYRECEAAFDPKYAGALGMPIDRVDFGDPIETIEELFADLSAAVKSKHPTLYIVDSLDALSDRGEMERDMEQGSYGAEKAKKLSQLFRRLVRQMSDANLTLMIISQVRSKIGIGYGRNTTRSGGRALDFYASQVVYLQHKGTERKTRRGITRPVSLKIGAKIDKNKVGLPLREATFEIEFGYGIDDLGSCVSFLKEAKMLGEAGIPLKGSKAWVAETKADSDLEFNKAVQRISQLAKREWYVIERGFVSKRRKYVA